MPRSALLIVLSFALVVTGCDLAPGRLNQTGSGTSGSVTPFSGNFGFTGTSSVSSTVFSIGGFLTSDSTGTVTATMHVAGSACFNAQTDVVAFTGKVASGIITATSAAVTSQVISLTGTISADGSTITAGTFTITGGCATGEKGTLTGNLVASLTASYTGNFTSGATVITVAASPLTQATTANPQGQFPITGSLLFSTSTCGLTGATITAGTVAGENVNLAMSGSDGISALSFTGTATDATGETINGTFSITGSGICSGLAGTAVLNHP